MKQQQRVSPVLLNQNQISSESSQPYSSEDQDAVLLTDKVQSKLLQTVAKIKNKDPSIYQLVKPIFEDQDFQQHHTSNHKNKQSSLNNNDKNKNKKYTYKDLMKQGVRSSQQQQSEQQHNSQQQNQYPQEEDQQLPPAMQQKKAKNKFKQALLKQKHITNNNQDDQLFTVKGKIKKQTKPQAKQQNDNQGLKKTKSQTKKLIQKVWNDNQKLDQTDVFLRDYILGKKWLSKHINGSIKPAQGTPQFQKIDEEDQERSVQMDEHEARYNFRYQQPDGDKIVQYPRKIQQSMRIKTQSRKDKRKKVQQRKKQQQKVYRQQAQKKKIQLKNNILAKLQQKQLENQQNNGQQMDQQEEQDFQHDWFFCDDCGKAFEEEQLNYQCAECQDYMLCQDCYDLIIHKHPLHKSIVPIGFGAPKQSVSTKVLAKLHPCKTCRRKIPQTLKHYSYQDKSKNLALMCQRCYDESPLDVKKKFTQVQAKINSTNIEEILQKDPQKVKQLTNSKQIQEMVDEYLKHQFEDVIGGGLKTKFKYINVKPQSYGLSDEQILFGDDKQLNNYISIKQLAPYKQRSMKLRNNIYNKKVKTINKSVNYNKQLIEKDRLQVRIKKTRVLDKMKRRSQVMKKKRQTKLKILNLSNPLRQQKMFVPSSRLESYGVTLENKQQNNYKPQTKK